MGIETRKKQKSLHFPQHEISYLVQTTHVRGLDSSYGGHGSDPHVPRVRYMWAAFFAG